MHYYQFNISDYKSHTEHLEPLEDLAYRRMLDWCYLHEKPLPKDKSDIARLIRMRSHSDCIANVLREFFTVNSDGDFLHKRVFMEIEHANEKSSKARESAKARWDKVKCDANALRPECEGNATQDPIPSTQDPIPSKPKSKNKFSDDQFAFAQGMFEKIKEVDVHAKQPNIENWADTIRLMQERDNLELPDMQQIFLWANNDPFWQSNILSPKKFREQYGKLIMQRNSNGTHQQSNKPISAADRARIANEAIINS